MLRIIVVFGAVAGLIVTAPFLIPLITEGRSAPIDSMFLGYLVMLLALSMVFVGVKRFRDRERGGVIRFGPALLVGLGISVVASLIYVMGWEISLAVTHFSFVDTYTAAMLRAAHAKGASPERLAQVAAQAQTFRTQYANPLFRVCTTFIEIFPVGLLVSLISAALLRNSRFLPATTVRT